MCVTSTAARRKRLFLGPSQNVFLCLSCEERRPRNTLYNIYIHRSDDGVVSHSCTNNLM